MELEVSPNENKPGFPIGAMVGTLICAAIVLFVASILLSNHNASSLPASGNKNWKLVFSDDFKGDTLDSGKWTTCYDWYISQYNGCSNNGNSELEWYMPQQVSLNKGAVTLNATEKLTSGINNGKSQTYEYESGMISTGRSNYNSVPKWTGKYGYYEARIKTTSGKGVWPAFWLLPADHSWPPEIDAMEIIGSKPNDVLMTYHWKSPNGQPIKDVSTYSNLTQPNGWHTYAVNWEPGYIDWYVDGKLRKSVSGSSVPSKSMEIIINLAIGGTLPGYPDLSTLKSASVGIDYVKVYQLTNKASK